jgi:hypothetical protein
MVGLSPVFWKASNRDRNANQQLHRLNVQALQLFELVSF